METLVLLDHNRNLIERGKKAREHAEDFWHGFLATVAARMPDPVGMLDKFIPELGISGNSEELSQEKEADLPPPSPEERLGIEQWMAQHMTGQITGADLAPKLNGHTP